MNMAFSPDLQKAFRNALGCFSTGVTIITCKTPAGEFVGLTANSFNSASLDPPLVLWSLAKKSINLGVFQEAEHFAVNILGAHQVDLSNTFASPVADRFDGVDFDEGAGGAPLIHGSSARFQCKKIYEYEGGDHVIFVGEVLEFDQTDAPPLVYQAGKYAVASEYKPEHQEVLSGGNMLHYLDRCYRQINLPFRDRLASSGITASESKLLGFLNAAETLEHEAISAFDPFLDEPARAVIKSLVAKGMVTDGEEYQLTDRGEGQIAPLLASAQSYESDVLGDLSEQEHTTILNFLRLLADKTARPGNPYIKISSGEKS